MTSRSEPIMAVSWFYEYGPSRLKLDMVQDAH